MTSAQSGHMVSAQKLINSLQLAQTDDPACVTLPNACAGHLVELQDGVKCRVFSVGLSTPNALPPDNWESVELPNAMPEATDGTVIDDTHVLVDQITCGLIGCNQITTVFGEHGTLDALHLHPPEGTDDASTYWADNSAQIKGALPAPKPD